MPTEIIVGAGSQITTIEDQDGATWATLVRDTDAIPGRASIIVTAPLGAGGFPVTVVLPVWATRAEIITPSGLGFTLPAGAAVISRASVGFPDDATSVQFWVRPASDAAHGLWRKRILRQPVADVVTPPPPTDRMTLSGNLTYTTTGVVGSALTITARPTASRTPDQTQTILRLYSALTGGTLSSTTNPVPTTVPNNDTLFGVPVYRVHDPIYDEWIEQEADARFDISTVTISPAAVVQGDLTITAAWKAGTGVLRQQAIHTFLCTGSPHGTLLEARIDSDRYTTGWVPCVQQVAANVWGFGTALMPADQPGAGRNCFEFYDLEDRFKIKFRRRASVAVQWSATSANLVFPMPTAGGAEQFNSLPTTRAEIQAAIIAGAASGSGPYVIGLAGNMDFAGGQVSVSNLNKPGEPIIIKPVNRAAPPVVRGITGRAFEINSSNNMIFDKINVLNDRTTAIGYPAGGVPMVEYADGHGFMLSGAQRIQVTDCLLRDLNVAIELRDCDDISINYVEIDRAVQDGMRLYRRNGNVLIVGEYQHDPEVYDEFALSAYKPNYHPDDIQTSCSMQNDWVRPAGTRMGGNRNIRRVRGRSYGVPRTGSRHTAGYWGATGLRDSGRDPGDTDMATGGARHRNANWLWEDMYIVSTWNAFPLAEAVDGFTMRRCVARKGHPNGRTPQLNLSLWATDIVVDNCVAGGGVYSIPTSAARVTQGFMTGPEMAAEVTLLNGGMNVSLTAWPAGWTGGETRFPTGPDAYR